MGVHQTGREFPKVQISGDSEETWVDERSLSECKRAHFKARWISSRTGLRLAEQERMLTRARLHIIVGHADAELLLRNRTAVPDPQLCEES